MLRCVKPKYVLAVCRHGILGRSHSAAVVAADFRIARAAVRRTDIFVLNIDSRCAESAVVCRIVRTRRAENYHKFIVLCGKNGERYLVSENKRSDIKRCAGCFGNPVRIFFDNRLDRCNKQVVGQIGNAHSFVRPLHSFNVHVGTEQLNNAVGSAVRFHALKHHLRIVKHAGSGLYRERLVRNHSAVVPALSLVIVHNEHMVGEILCKSEFCLVLRTRLRMGRSCNGKIVRHNIRTPFQNMFLFFYIVNVFASVRKDVY